ncbi:diaminopimelate decarboxylase [Mycobacterium sp. AZCC_0083]|nr:diaminopimelate decarboxylase [Mycobacterium sp. AZCC_0083]
MNPLRRLQFRDALRSQARTHRWSDLIAEHGTPLLVLDPYRVAAQYSMLNEHLRGFRLHYAVKVLPHPAVITVLAACGSSFDVATTAEVDHVRSLGVPMDRCIHTHPVKKPADIDHAYAQGIRTFVVDNPVEAQKFVGRPSDIGIVVRLSFPNPSAKSDLSAKFGVDPAEAELLVKHVIAAGSGSRASASTWAARARRCSRTGTRFVRRSISPSTSSGRLGCGCRASTSAAASRCPIARTCRR